MILYMGSADEILHCNVIGHHQSDPWSWVSEAYVNGIRPRRNGRYFADTIFKSIFLNVNFRSLLQIPHKFAPKGPLHSNPQID